MIGLRALPMRLLQPVTSWFLKLLRFAIGPGGPLEDAAIARLRRAGLVTNG